MAAVSSAPRTFWMFPALSLRQAVTILTDHAQNVAWQDIIWNIPADIQYLLLALLGLSLCLHAAATLHGQLRHCAEYWSVACQDH